MFSHVMVGTNDIERSKRFYDAGKHGYKAIALSQFPYGNRHRCRLLHGSLLEPCGRMNHFGFC